MSDPIALSPEVHAGLDAAVRDDPELGLALEQLASIGSHPRNGRGRPTEIAAVGDKRRLAAHLVNRKRGAELRDKFIARPLTSKQVAELLDVADHRAVQARRARRTLLGWTIGNETYHPDWQFTDAGPVTELGRVVKALTAVTSSPLAADQMMRRERDDLDGRSLADLLADGQVGIVLRLVAAADA